MSKFIPSSQTDVYKSFGQLKVKVNNIDKEKSYGLIHGDIRELIVYIGMYRSFDFIDTPTPKGASLLAQIGFLSS
ncbi:hypothetical protein [Paenibacillus uliginis]|uniref:hypothetical protein n=1 Tax=Paenibacillus uliginis TaxID=683737 RepID=UPI001AD84ADC|nr:hypothetical protein [Paenibacillus uliginis]